MKKFSEGKIEFYAPEGEITKKLPVFYNPLMQFDRDLTLAIAKEIGGESYCDGLAGSGIRGMRAAKEAGFKEVFLNDSNPEAVSLIKRNLGCNKIDANVSCEDINSFLRRFKCDKIDIIDLDPFGSFIGALDSAIRSVNRAGGLLCLTATDTAPLCGVSVKTCQRRYDARPLKTHYAKEIGLRILIGACARMVARYDSAIEPVFSYNRRHYFRLFLRSSRGISRANRMLKNMGYLQHCFKCCWRGYTQIDCFLDSCPNCGNELKWAGPLWIGKFTDPAFCEKLETENPKVQKLIDTVSQEQEITLPFFDVHHLSSLKKKPAPKKSGLLESGCLETHFNRWGVRCRGLPDI